MRISDWSSDVCSSDLWRRNLASSRLGRGRCRAGGYSADPAGAIAGALTPPQRPASTGSGLNPPCGEAMGRWQPGADGGAMARGCCPSTTRLQRAVPLPMASPQGGSAMAAPHPKADVRIILSYIIGPCSKLADGTYRSEEHTSELQSLMRIS